MQTVAELKPDFSLQGQVALVTGASRGIGRACAIACAQAGASVVVGLRDIASGEDLIAELQSTGQEVLPVVLDITKPSDRASALDAVLKRFGRIDILVNNVGVAPGNRIEDVVEEDFDLTVEVNLKGTFFLTQAVGRIMIAQKYGRIVNISSQAGTEALPGEAVYCMTKAGINHLTKCLAREWAEHGISVNSVAPTFVWTDSTRPVLADKAFYDRTVGHIPLGRIGETSEVAGAVVFLASPAASLITGANLLVDGGWSLV